MDVKRAETHLGNRKAPMARLIQKLGLRQFRNVGPLNNELLATDKVGIKLKQHIGAPCDPLVKVGDRVAKGQVIGRPPVSQRQAGHGRGGACVDRRHGDRGQRRRDLDSVERNSFR